MLLIYIQYCCIIRGYGCQASECYGLLSPLHKVRCTIYSHRINMFPVITIIFLLVPIIEIYLLIEVGQVIGALWTALLVVLTAVIGVRLLKIQGISTLTRAQNKMQTGQASAAQMPAVLLRVIRQRQPGMLLKTKTSNGKRKSKAWVFRVRLSGETKFLSRLQLAA